MDRPDERIEDREGHNEPETRKKESLGQALGFVLIVYAVSRLFYLVAGAWFARIIPVSAFQRLTSDRPFGTFNIWAHWDGEHYVGLAAGGYMQPPDNVSPAFFPLYSMLVRSFAGLFGGPLSPGALSLWGVLVSLLFLPFAMYFVYRISEDGWGPRAARGTVLVLAFFPAAFFLNAAYTESLFLALSAGSLWALRVRRDLLLACVLAGLATATRNVGVFLLVPLLYEWFRNRDRYGWRLVYLALAPSGLILYASYLWVRFGNPLLFYTEQERWGRGNAGPLGIVSNVLRESGEGIARLFGPGLLADPTLGKLVDRVSSAQNAFDLALLGLIVAVLILGWRVLPPDLSAYSLLLVAPAVLFGPAQNPLMGLPRYALVAFPLFIVLGVLLDSRRSLGIWLAVSAAASLVLCAMFVSWRFVA
ncbi:MAG: mannosyltransferase family protein [Rubrobacteraceae bacterium]|nr:hypothetical protein [Rubrobacter sp.]